ncbi:hypothetical protein SCANM63S_04411 [Streptomyces canarius]
MTHVRARHAARRFGPRRALDEPVSPMASDPPAYRELVPAALAPAPRAATDAVSAP